MDGYIRIWPLLATEVLMVFLKVIYPEGQMNNLKLHYASSHKVQNILRNVDKQTQNAKARLDGDRHG